jgi:hypothetical protein
MRVPKVLSYATVVFIPVGNRRPGEEGIGHGDTFQQIAEDAWAGLHPDLPMPSEIETEVHMRDIRGSLAPAETGEREVCMVCGMVANLDPGLHSERYAHPPVVKRNGRLWRFSFYTYSFSELLPEG